MRVTARGVGVTLFAALSMLFVAYLAAVMVLGPPDWLVDRGPRDVFGVPDCCLDPGQAEKLGFR